MARIRSIKPEFWGDPKTCRVSRDARLLFLGLLNVSDDEGYQLGSERRILGEVFPNDDNVAINDIHRWLNELEDVDFIRRYEVDDVPYLHICGFVAHQKVAHPSPSRIPHEPLAPDLGIDLGIDLGSDRVPPPWRDSGEKPIDFITRRAEREDASEAG